MSIQARVFGQGQRLTVCRRNTQGIEIKDEKDAD
jgi:hypothetical protein